MTVIGYIPRLTINAKGIITHAEEVAIEGGAINWRGAWVAGSPGYLADDVVEHNGSSWIATVDTQDEPGVGSPNGWDLIAAKGDDGANGADGPPGMGVWRGAWTGSGYDALDIVEHLGSTWITQVPTTDEPGVGSPNDWELVASKGDTGATGPAGSVDSVTDIGTGAIVTVDNSDPTNPVVDFAGVETDGVTITGDGTAGSPLVASSTDIFPKKTYRASPAAEGTVIFDNWFVGTALHTTAGAPTNPGADVDGTWQRCTGNNSVCGTRWHTGTTTQCLTAGVALPRIRFRVRTGGDVTSVRIFVGLRAASATPATDTQANMCLVRYSTNVSDSPNWTAVTVDASGNVNTTPIVAIAINTVYDIDIEYLSATAVKFTINGTPVTITHATQIPSGNLTPHCTITSLVVGNRTLDWSIMQLDTK